ncbi:MAG TPA: hypothetical protein VFJ16_20755 [Longimicrobium sp.]|nr:hypothetical protein [Longimicrobium sp.]
MKRYPGQVWFLPPEFEAGGDSKRRPHLLLTTCDEDDNGVFSYGSTKPTEALFGAAFLIVDPAASADPQTGFTRPTYIYPSRLVAVAPVDFGRLAGRLTHHLPQVRELLATALGLGSGTTVGFGAASFSWRGRVVLLSVGVSDSLGYRYGIVLTEATYSRSQRYQIIVPMDDLAHFQAEPGDIVRADLSWLSMVDPEMTAVLIGVADVQSVFHPVDIERWTGAVVDDGTLNDIEEALKKLFEL